MYYAYHVLKRFKASNFERITMKFRLFLYFTLVFTIYHNLDFKIYQKSKFIYVFVSNTIQKII